MRNSDGNKADHSGSAIMSSEDEGDTVDDIVEEEEELTPESSRDTLDTTSSKAVVAEKSVSIASSPFGKRKFGECELTEVTSSKKKSKLSLIPVSNARKHLSVKLKRCGLNESNANVDLDAMATISGEKLVDDRISLIELKWPGRVCCLCNLGECSQLGQGSLLDVHIDKERLAGAAVDNLSSTYSLSSAHSDSNLSLVKKQKRSSNLAAPSSPFEPVDELSVIGFSQKTSIGELCDSSGTLLIHRNCASWSNLLVDGSERKFSETLVEVIEKSLSRFCSYCNRFGASVSCSFGTCAKYYHFACSTASANFHHKLSRKVICHHHLDHVTLLDSVNDVTCVKCHSLGDVTNIFMCSTCSNLYHGVCVGVALHPGTRAGWQCSSCIRCQVCRSEDSSKLTICEACAKGYHTSCLRPVPTTMPKMGWKCKCCRVCSDCGSRTPGSGQSSRWHSCYTVCDSCYQQRNKGFFCPICHRAYRAGSMKEMIQCAVCAKYVHGTCDADADPAVYKSKKDASSEYQYICLNCKNQNIRERIFFKKKEGPPADECNSTASTAPASSSKDSFTYEDYYEDFDRESDDMNFPGVGLGKGKPFSARKKISYNLSKGFRSKQLGKKQKKLAKNEDSNRKRLAKANMRGVFGAPGLGLQRPIADPSKSESSDLDNENRIVLCSADDLYVLGGDLCSMCGALGTDQEGCLISCVQCGQCYHPYCVNVKVTKLILEKGWRCLDCTVCEGCGQRNDESRLILCDDCDVSYHIYCMDPKLDYVPRGTWKCKWCAQCLTCGSNDAGVNSTWLKNYTECGPCASRLDCPVCLISYCDNELVIRCYNCDRWLHGSCDQIQCEEEAKKCSESGYSCILCRPKDVPPPHLVVIPPIPSPKPSTPHHQSAQALSPARKSPEIVKEEAEFVVDGVVLSDTGNMFLKSVMPDFDSPLLSKEQNKANKKKKPITKEEQNILDSIESVIAASVDEMDETEEEISSKVVYKDGMIMELLPDGSLPEAPEGFNITTGDNGVLTLRKKRIRKIGIGGFNAPKVIKMPKQQNGREVTEDESWDGCFNEDSGTPSSQPQSQPQSQPLCSSEEKPKKKKVFTKQRKYPSYVTDAFFGRDLLECFSEVSNELESSEESESDENIHVTAKKLAREETVQLTEDELEIMQQIQATQRELKGEDLTELSPAKIESMDMKFEIKQEAGTPYESGSSLKDFLNLPHHSFLNSLIADDKSILKDQNSLLNDSCLTDESSLNISVDSSQSKDDLSDLMAGNNFMLDSMVEESADLPNMDSKDVEKIFEEVLTGDPLKAGVLSQPDSTNEKSDSDVNLQMSGSQNDVRRQVLPNSQAGSLAESLNATATRNIHLPPSQQSIQSNTVASPIHHYPSSSPYHSDFGEAHSQYSPSSYSEPPASPWPSEDGIDGSQSQSAMSNFQKNSARLEQDEALGANASISAVLYCNIHHPELKVEYPVWSERWKQIQKKWRTLPQEKKAPILNMARENRSKQKSRKCNIPDHFTSPQPKSDLDKHWKSLQSLRQQQQQQQHSSQETSLQGAQKKQTNPSTQSSSEQTFDANRNTQLHVAVSQENNSSKSPRDIFVSPIAKMSPSQSPQTSSATGSFPSPQYYPNTTPQYQLPNFQARSADEELLFSNAQSPEMTRQLRELLQKEPSDKPEPSGEQQRIWNRDTSANGQRQVVGAAQNSATLLENKITDGGEQRVVRHPGIQNIIRQNIRLPIGSSNLIRQKLMEVRSPLAETQFRLLIQQQQQGQSHMQQQFQQSLQQQQLRTQLQQQLSQPAQQIQKNATLGVAQQHQPGLSQQQQQQQQQHQTILQQQRTMNQQTMAQQQTVSQQQDPQQGSVTQQQLLQQARQQQQQQQIQLQLPQHLSRQQQLQLLEMQKNQLLSKPLTKEQFQLIHVARNRQYLAMQKLQENTGSQQQQLNLQQQLKQLEVEEQQKQQQRQYEMRQMQFQRLEQQLLQQSPQKNNAEQIKSEPTEEPANETPPAPSHSTPPLSVTSTTVAPNSVAAMPAPPHSAPPHFAPPPSFEDAIKAVKVESERSASVPATLKSVKEEAQDFFKKPELPSDLTSELPDNVAADLQKLADESIGASGMSEMDNVGSLLGDLIEDELFAEIGDNFNILEYADPELDNLSCVEQNSILYDLVHAASNTKDENGEFRREDDDIVDASELSPMASSTMDKLLENQMTKVAELSTDERGATLPADNVERKPTDAQSNPVDKNEDGKSVQMDKSKMEGTFGASNNFDQAQGSSAPTGEKTPLILASQQAAIPNASTCDIPPMTENELLAVPPPPPYPGPPPPYHAQLKTAPSNLQQLIQRSPSSLNIPTNNVRSPRQPVLLQEQPLLLEDLLEQEKREQEKHHASMSPGSVTFPMSDAEFERLRADVMNSSNNSSLAASGFGKSAHNVSVVNMQSLHLQKQPQQQLTQQGYSPAAQIPYWMQSQATAANKTGLIPAQLAANQVKMEAAVVTTPLFNATPLAQPPDPPDTIVTEEDRAAQVLYEQWLEKQNAFVVEQLKYYETEIGKLRKVRKSMSSKQRGLRKNGNELNDKDMSELQRITTEQNLLQKHLDSSRKNNKAHAQLVQEYRVKHPARVLRMGMSLADANLASSTNPAKVIPPVVTVQQAGLGLPQFKHNLPTQQMQSNSQPQRKFDDLTTTKEGEDGKTNVLASQMRPLTGANQHLDQLLKYPAGPVRIIQGNANRPRHVLTLQTLDSTRLAAANPRNNLVAPTGAGGVVQNVAGVVQNIGGVNVGIVKTDDALRNAVAQQLLRRRHPLDEQTALLNLQFHQQRMYIEKEMENIAEKLKTSTSHIEQQQLNITRNNLFAKLKTLNQLQNTPQLKQQLLLRQRNAFVQKLQLQQSLQQQNLQQQTLQQQQQPSSQQQPLLQQQQSPQQQQFLLQQQSLLQQQPIQQQQSLQPQQQSLQQQQQSLQQQQQSLQPQQQSSQQQALQQQTLQQSLQMLCTQQSVDQQQQNKDALTSSLPQQQRIPVTHISQQHLQQQMLSQQQQQQRQSLLLSQQQHPTQQQGQQQLIVSQQQQQQQQQQQPSQQLLSQQIFTQQQQSQQQQQIQQQNTLSQTQQEFQNKVATSQQQFGETQRTDVEMSSSASPSIIRQQQIRYVPAASQPGNRQFSEGQNTHTFLQNILQNTNTSQLPQYIANRKSPGGSMERNSVVLPQHPSVNSPITAQSPQHYMAPSPIPSQSPKNPSLLPPSPITSSRQQMISPQQSYPSNSPLHPPQSPHSYSGMIPPASPSSAPSQSPRVQQLTSHGGTPKSPSYAGYGPGSPAPLQSPRHAPQFAHPAHSPAQIEYGGNQYLQRNSPLPDRSPVHLRPLSAGSVSGSPHSGSTTPHSEAYGVDSGNAGSGGGGGSSSGGFFNTIPVPIEFQRLGIKHGLPGGNPDYQICKNVEKYKSDYSSIDEMYKEDNFSSKKMVIEDNPNTEKECKELKDIWRHKANNRVMCASDCQIETNVNCRKHATSPNESTLLRTFQEFHRHGIRPGLLGGSPTWNKKVGEDGADSSTYNSEQGSSLDYSNAHSYPQSVSDPENESAFDDDYCISIKTVEIVEESVEDSTPVLYDSSTPDGIETTCGDDNSQSSPQNPMTSYSSENSQVDPSDQVIVSMGSFHSYAKPPSPVYTGGKDRKYPQFEGEFSGQFKRSFESSTSRGNEDKLAISDASSVQSSGADLESRNQDLKNAKDSTSSGKKSFLGVDESEFSSPQKVTKYSRDSESDDTINSDYGNSDSTIASKVKVSTSFEGECNPSGECAVINRDTSLNEFNVQMMLSDMVSNASDSIDSTDRQDSPLLDTEGETTLKSSKEEELSGASKTSDNASGFTNQPKKEIDEKNFSFADVYNFSDYSIAKSFCDSNRASTSKSHDLANSTTSSESHDMPRLTTTSKLYDVSNVTIKSESYSTSTPKSGEVSNLTTSKSDDTSNFKLTSKLYDPTTTRKLYDGNTTSKLYDVSNVTTTSSKLYEMTSLPSVKSFGDSNLDFSTIGKTNKDITLYASKCATDSDISVKTEQESTDDRSTNSLFQHMKLPSTQLRDIKVTNEGARQAQFIPLSSLIKVTRSNDSDNALLKQLLQNVSCAEAPTLHPPAKLNIMRSIKKPIPTPTSTISTIMSPASLSSSISDYESIFADKSKASKIDSSSPISNLTRDSTDSIKSSASEAELSSSKDENSSVTETMSDVIEQPVTGNWRQPLNVVTSSTSDAYSTPDGAARRQNSTDELTSPSKVPEPSVTPNSICGGDGASPLSGAIGGGAMGDIVDLKKLKRRQYSQQQAAKRRQSQAKEHLTPTPNKKRVRRLQSPKVDEDYDSYIDNLMEKIRSLPTLPIAEPVIAYRYSVCPPYGAGEAIKINSNCSSWTTGDLKGTFGSCTLPGTDDFYNAVPFGVIEPIQKTVGPPTQRGFYHEEFSSLKFDIDYETRRLEMARFDRETESPDSVVSSSSPECVMPAVPTRFQGLKLIDENDSCVESDDDERVMRSISPVIPIIIPLAIRPKASKNHPCSDEDKENRGKQANISNADKIRDVPTAPLKDCGNMTVTLTIHSDASHNIAFVLNNLANLLNIAPPTAYKITERIPSPIKDVDKEVDIKEENDASLLKIPASRKICCLRCDAAIVADNSVKKKASDTPFVMCTDECDNELYFCSSSCYLQMALLQPPIISEPTVSSSEDVWDGGPAKKIKLEPAESTDNHLPSIKNIFKNISETRKNAISNEEVSSASDSLIEEPEKGVQYLRWSPSAIPSPSQRLKKLSEKDIMELLFRMSITVPQPNTSEDARTCMFCHQVGDGVADGPARLLNYDVDKWMHLNCALWSEGVYETVNGALMNVDPALQQGANVQCTYCERTGATLKCFKYRCTSVYHLSCAVKHECVFFENKTVYCSIHVPKGEKENELTTLAVFRRVYVNRDETRQIASIMTSTDQHFLLRIGSLIFLNVGQLLPHQLVEFHNPNYIYPVGYKIIRFYWSMRVFNKRCQYICSIHDVAGRPEFRILIQEPGQVDLEFRGASPKSAWTRILDALAVLRQGNNSVNLFSRYINGEDLFGLTEPAIVRILESLPGIETLTDYKFKYGKNPLLELPLAVNPSGCARCEPKIKGPSSFKRLHAQRTHSSSLFPRPMLSASSIFQGADGSSVYSKSFVHSKSSQYKKMKQEWKNNVYIARSKIQGLGLYAAKDIEKHTMVIEYIGEIIRTDLSDFREKQYEAKNRGIYMFQLDEERVVDATIQGGLARYINHSCNPNCVTEKVEVDRELRIIIFSKRRIVRGEELSYDYQFDIEDDQHKIPCLCGAPNCRKWMN